MVIQFRENEHWGLFWSFQGHAVIIIKKKDGEPTLRVKSHGQHPINSFFSRCASNRTHFGARATNNTFRAVEWSNSDFYPKAARMKRMLEEEQEMMMKTTRVPKPSISSLEAIKVWFSHNCLRPLKFILSFITVHFATKIEVQRPKATDMAGQPSKWQKYHECPEVAPKWRQVGFKRLEINK